MSRNRNRRRHSNNHGGQQSQNQQPRPQTGPIQEHHNVIHPGGQFEVDGKIIDMQLRESKRGPFLVIVEKRMAGKEERMSPLFIPANDGALETLREGLTEFIDFLKTRKEQPAAEAPAEPAPVTDQAPAAEVEAPEAPAPEPAPTAELAVA